LHPALRLLVAVRGSPRASVRGELSRAGLRLKADSPTGERSRVAQASKYTGGRKAMGERAKVIRCWLSGQLLKVRERSRRLSIRRVVHVCE
jgi:hypothetical protein